jgi:hypothetical protein
MTAEDHLAQVRMDRLHQRLDRLVMPRVAVFREEALPEAPFPEPFPEFVPASAPPGAVGAWRRFRANVDNQAATLKSVKPKHAILMSEPEAFDADSGSRGRDGAAGGAR